MSAPTATQRRVLLTGGLSYPALKQPWWDWPHPPQWAAVLRDEGDAAPLAIARLFDLWLVSPQATIHAAGIGGVFTAAGCRGQGFATELLDEVERTAPEQLEWHPRALVLHARPDRTLYTRIGYVEIADGLYAKTLIDGVQLNAGHWTTDPEGHF